MLADMDGVVPVDVEGRTFGEALRLIRDRRGLSQAQVCRATGLSRPTIHGLETGRTGRPSPQTMWLLDDAYRLSRGTVRRLNDELAPTPVLEWGAGSGSSEEVEVLLRAHRRLQELEGADAGTVQAAERMAGQSLVRHFDGALEGLSIPELVGVYIELGDKRDLAAALREQVREILAAVPVDDLVKLYRRGLWSESETPPRRILKEPPKIRLADGQVVGLRQYREEVLQLTQDKAAQLLTQARRDVDAGAPAVKAAAVSAHETGLRGVRADMRGAYEKAYGLSAGQFVLDYVPVRAPVRGK